jgi:hypothetical protein
MDGVDIWRAADQMMKLYGADAAIAAGLRADAMLDLGDTPGFNAWKRIVAAIGDLERKEPAADETLN